MHMAGGLLSLLAVAGLAAGQQLGLSSCCIKLRLESSAQATVHQSNRLGEYSLMGLFSDRPMYKHDEKEEFLFYLTSRNRGLWMVGPEVGQFNGGLANRGDPMCAEDTPTGQWKYTDGRSWNLDSSLSVTCMEQELPECVYRDQTNFEGGDLPVALGGGGLETSAVSSAECIEECEGRTACRYWTWTGETGVNCFLKTDKLTQERRPKHVSGSVSSACSQPQPPAVPEGRSEPEPQFNEQEINGKFKITSLRWDDKLSDPASVEYQELSNSIEDSLESMLRNDGDLGEQVEEFTVTVQRFTKGSVVCDFKVNYILKEAYVAIPFAIKPANITDAMGKNFKFKKGILFQRFLIAANSFAASAPVDHCAAKGCSHKCDYDYDIEDYMCTCPRTLVLDTAEKKCLTPEEAAAERATTESPAVEASTEKAEEEAEAAEEITTKAAQKEETDETVTEQVIRADEDDVEVTTQKAMDEDEEDGEVTTLKAIDEEIEDVEITTQKAKDEEAEDVEVTTQKAIDEEVEVVEVTTQKAIDEEVEDVEVTTQKAIDEDEVEVVTAPVEAPTEESTSTNEATTPIYEDFGAVEVEEDFGAEEGEEDSTTVATEVEGSGRSDAEILPSFGDRVTTTEAAATTAADMDTTSADTTVGETATEKAVQEEAQETDETTVATPVEEPATTTLPEMVIKVIDDVINDLFSGSSTEGSITEGSTTEGSTTEEDGGEEITAGPVVITVDEEELAGEGSGEDNVEFSTLAPIRPLEDPTQGGEGEEAEEPVEVTTVKIEEFTAETTADIEVLDQTAEDQTDAPVPDEEELEKRPRLDVSNEITTDGGHPEETTMPSTSADDETEAPTATPEIIQPSIAGETTTKKAEVEESEVTTGMPEIPTTVMPESITESDDTGSEDTDNVVKDQTEVPEVTTLAPTTVTVLSVEETEDGFTLVTTARPQAGAVTTALPGAATTLMPPVETTTLPAEAETATLMSDSDPVITTVQAEGTTLKTDSDETIGPVAETTVSSDQDTTTLRTDTEVTTLTEDTADDNVATTDSEVVTTMKTESSEISTPRTEVTTLETDSEVPDDAMETESSGEGRSTLDEVTTLKPESDDTTIAQEIEITSQQPEGPQCERICHDLWAPVCGSDGVTYPNDCSLEIGNCQSGGQVILRQQGECTETTTISQETDNQETTTTAQDTEGTTLPSDSAGTTIEFVDETTISQAVLVLGPATELTPPAAPEDGPVTTGPEDADLTPSPEEGSVTTSRPEDPVVTMLTTARPTEEEAATEVPEVEEEPTEMTDGEEEVTTLATPEEDTELHEFDCSEITDAQRAFADPNQIPLECRLRGNDGEQRTVYIVIPKQGLDTDRLFSKNVKVVIKDLMIMDISPK